MKQIAVPTDIMEIHPNAFALEVKGDCMEPTVSDGSYILVDPDTNPAKDGTQIGAVEVDGTMYLCRPRHIMNHVIIFHDNKKYPNVTVKSCDAHIHGSVVWVGSTKEESDKLSEVG